MNRTLTLKIVKDGTYCLAGWRPSSMHWPPIGGCSCNREEGHRGRHRCQCGSTRLRRDDDPTWEEDA